MTRWKRGKIGSSNTLIPGRRKTQVYELDGTPIYSTQSTICVESSPGEGSTFTDLMPSNSPAPDDRRVYAAVSIGRSNEAPQDIFDLSRVRQITSNMRCELRRRRSLQRRLGLAGVGGSAKLFAENYGFGNLAHIFPALPAFFLHHTISLLLIDAEFTLQQAFGAFHQLA